MDNLFAGLGTWLVPGIMTGLGFVAILSRFPLLKVAGYATLIDVVFTIGLPFMLSSTFIGFGTAIIAGLVLSAFLSGYRFLHGYARYNVKTRRWTYHAR